MWTDAAWSAAEATATMHVYWIAVTLPSLSENHATKMQPMRPPPAKRPFAAVTAC